MARQSWKVSFTTIFSKYYEWIKSSKPALNGNNVNGPFHHELTNASSESSPKPLTPVTNV